MANIYDLNIQQNATFDMTMQLTDGSGSYIDISQWDISGSIKTSFKDATPLVSFNVAVVSAVSGAIELTLTPVQTSVFVKAQYVYDVIAKNKATVPVTVYRLLQGVVHNDLGVTAAQ